MFHLPWTAGRLAQGRADRQRKRHSATPARRGTRSQCSALDSSVPWIGNGPRPGRVRTAALRVGCAPDVQNQTPPLGSGPRTGGRGWSR